MIDILLQQMSKRNVKITVKTRYSQDEYHLGKLC